MVLRLSQPRVPSFAAVFLLRWHVVRHPLGGYMKQKISLLLAMILCFSLFMAPVASAEVSFGEAAGYYGDVDDSYRIDAKDALMVLKYAVQKITLTGKQAMLADVDANNAINAKDALLMLRYSVGSITEFPAGDFIDTYEMTTEGYVDPDAVYVNYQENDFGYDTTLSVNGAYQIDTSADTSFVMDMTGLTPNTVYVISGAVFANNDISRLVFSLQGLVNRDFGRDANHTSIMYVNTDTTDSKWWEYMKSEGSVYENMERVVISTWATFYETFQNQIKYCGIILWDGNVPATANVAATICGLDGYLPVLANSPFHATLKEAGVEEKQSLVGLFENGKKGEKIAGTNVISTGSAKNDAYRWALEKYFNRCSSNYLAYILDGAPTLKGYDAYPNHPTALLRNAGSNCLANHDYLIARRCFFFDLAPYKGEAACDDPSQTTIYELDCTACGDVAAYEYDDLMGIDDPVCAKCGETVSWWNRDASFNEVVKTVVVAEAGLDNETMLMIYERRYQRANGAMGQLMGFPPWWLKYTSTDGQGSQTAPWIEWLFCEYISCYNLAKEADAAAPSSMTNGSAFYKYVPLQKEYKNNFEEFYKNSGLEYNEDTYYYTIYMGDYDSSAWLKQHVHNFFLKNGGDRGRGQIPITWCFNPNLSLRVPMVFDYVYANKKDNEFFAAGDSGAGYVIPSGLFGNTKLNYMEEERPAQFANGDVQWANYCKKFYERFDMKATGFIINGSNSFTTDILGMFNSFSTMGGLHNGYGALMTNYKGTPYIYCQNGLGDPTSSTGKQVETMYEHATVRMAGYNFGAYRTICWSPTDVKRLAEDFKVYAAEKGLKVQYVELYSLLTLAKESGQGYVVK